MQAQHYRRFLNTRCHISKDINLAVEFLPRERESERFARSGELKEKGPPGPASANSHFCVLRSGLAKDSQIPTTYRPRKPPTVSHGCCCPRPRLSQKGNDLCRTTFPWGPESRLKPITVSCHLIPVQEQFFLEELLLVWKRLPCGAEPALAFSHLRQLVSEGTGRPVRPPL